MGAHIFVPGAGDELTTGNIASYHTVGELRSALCTTRSVLRRFLDVR